MARRQCRRAARTCCAWRQANFVIAAARDCRGQPVAGRRSPRSSRRPTTAATSINLPERRQRVRRRSGPARRDPAPAHDRGLRLRRRSTASTGRRHRLRWRNSSVTRGLQSDAPQGRQFLRDAARRGAIAIIGRTDLVQRHAASTDGRGRRRRRQGGHQPRLVSHRARQVPASGHAKPGQTRY